MLTTDSTCVARTPTGVHFDGPTADGSGHAAHEVNQGCSRATKLAVHTTASWLFGSQLASAQVYSQLYVTSPSCVSTFAWL